MIHSAIKNLYIISFGNVQLKRKAQGKFVNICRLLEVFVSLSHLTVTGVGSCLARILEWQNSWA